MLDQSTTMQNSLLYRPLDEKLANSKGVYFAIYTDTCLETHQTDLFTPHNAGELLFWWTEVKTYGKRTGHTHLQICRGKYFGNQQFKFDACLEECLRTKRGDWLNASLFREMMKFDENLGELS